MVVRPAQAEMSHEVVKISKKRWDSETGKAWSDYSQEVTEAQCDSEILSIDNQIAELNATKDGWTALKADIKAL